MIDRALVTFGVGPMAELLEIARPSFDEFASRHGYEVVTYEPEEDPWWPFAWLKVSCLQDALVEFEEVLWVDADIVITDPSEDIPFNPNCWQALAVHRTRDGEVPNTGVWAVRREMEPVFESLWRMFDYRNHPWWEQGALMYLLGYNSWARPTVFHEPTELFRRTHFLSNEWNSHPWDEAERPRFMHATMREDRAAAMREWAGA